MEAKIKAFHSKADTLIDMDDLEDLTSVDVHVDEGERDMLEEWAGVDSMSVVDDEDVGEEEDAASSGTSSDEADFGADLEYDEGELLAYPETMALSLPSRLGKDYISRHGLETLAKGEIELRVGQANDSLAALQVELGHKSLLFCSKVWYSKNQKGKTRAWKEVAQSAGRLMKHVARYQCAQQALHRLEADEEILEKYQDIKKENLKMRSDMVYENRFGQRNDTLAWFWRLGPQTDAEGDLWMEECTWILPLKLIGGTDARGSVYRVNWLGAKCRHDRWDEDLDQLRHEMTWTLLYFEFLRLSWEGRASISE